MKTIRYNELTNEEKAAFEKVVFGEVEELKGKELQSISQGLKSVEAYKDNIGNQMVGVRDWYTVTPTITAIFTFESFMIYDVTILCKDVREVSFPKNMSLDLSDPDNFYMLDDIELDYEEVLK